MFLLKKSPEKAFFKKIYRLKRAVVRLRNDGSGNVRPDPLVHVWPNASSFFNDADTAERRFRSTGRITWNSLVSLRRRFESLRFGLGSVSSFTACVKNRSGLANDITGVARSLDELSNSNLREIQSSIKGRIPDSEVLRESVATVDKSLAGRLSVNELEEWTYSGPVTDFDNPQQVERLARLLVLDRVPDQVWEVRCRTSPVVRRLQLVGLWGGLPNMDDLWRIARDRNALEMIVAARRPSWRIVWVEKFAGM